MSDPRWLSDASDAGRRALREALDEAPAFAPSDVRRRRVWADLARPRLGRRVSWRAFAAGAGLASLLTALGFLSAPHWPHFLKSRQAARAPAPSVVTDSSLSPRSPPSPALAKVASASASAPAPAARPETEEETLTPGALIGTGASERIARRLPSGAVVDIQPGSELSIDENARPEVRKGEVRFDVPAQPAARPFVMRIASYHVVVAGARFSVRVAPRAARVAVEEGAVEIWARGRLARVEAGENWRHRLGALDARGSAAGPHPDGAPAPASAASDVADLADLAAAGAARASDPARAVSIYERLSARGGPAAENALYQLGVTYHDQVGDRDRALAAWERYRARYPHGQLRVETDLSIIDTLAELGRKARALDEGLAFLRHHPASERRSEVARVAADLARVRGQCRLAATLYAEVSEAQASANDADDAAFGRASCLQALGDARADQAVAEYLATHPRGRHVAEAQRLAQSRKPAQP